jgi:predicted ATP-grasp superfamily ATP-dependent carboligase
VKPRFSCSGRGVRFIEAGAALPPADGEPSLVQEFCAGRLLSTFTLARAGAPRITVTYRGAVMQGTVAVCFERIDTPPAVEAWVGAMVRHTGFDGFISFDLVEDAAGAIRGIECNPRATSGIHFVDPSDLAAALLAPQSDRPLRFKPERLMQQFYPCLTETQRTMFGAGPFRQNLRHLVAARDVTWSARDPWPLVSQPWTSWPIIEMSMRRRCTFGEVAMLDLAWGGG